MKITVTRKLEWDAAHRVLRHESKCATLHGHHYVALITATADKLDDKSRVVDFGVIKERVGTWIDDHWDHTTLVNTADTDLLSFTRNDAAARGLRQPYPFDGEPTAEAIAVVLMAVAQAMLEDSGVTVDKVEVFETPNCSATVHAGMRIHQRFDTFDPGGK